MTKEKELSELTEPTSQKRIKQLMYIDIEKSLTSGLNNSYKFYTDSFGQEVEKFEPVHDCFMKLTAAANDFLLEVKNRMVRTDADLIIEEETIESLEKQVIQAQEKIANSREVNQELTLELADVVNKNESLTTLSAKLTKRMIDKNNENDLLKEKSAGDEAENEKMVSYIEELTAKVAEMIAEIEDAGKLEGEPVEGEKQETASAETRDGTEQTTVKVEIPVLPDDEKMPVQVITVDVPAISRLPLPSLPESNTWQCSCGRSNTDKNRCTRCAKSKIAAQNELLEK